MKDVRILKLGKNANIQFPLQFSKSFLASKGVNLEIEDLQWQLPEEMYLLLQDSKSKAQAVLVDPQISEAFIEQLPAAPSSIMSVLCTDCLILENGQWWPYLLVKKVLHELLIQRGKSLNIRESAYVVGEGANLRILISIVAQMGFSKIFAVSENKEDLEKQTKYLKKKFVGIDMRSLPADGLTMQTVGGSLIISSYDLSEKQALATDLSYFNFMSKNGLVVDINLFPIHNPMLEEAHRAQLQTISGSDILGLIQDVFLQKIGCGHLYNRNEFRNGWLEYSKTITAS